MVNGFKSDSVIVLTGGVPPVLLQLRQERRDQVKRHMDTREFLEDRHHTVIIFQSVEPHPRHHIDALRQVLIERLVHVP